MVGAADHLQLGMALPRIALPATTGQEICLADVPGQSVLIVYPWTGRPGHPNPPNWDDIEGAHGSTPELEGFRDLSPDFAVLNVGLFGLSRQATDYQREMALRLRLPFPILSDADGSMTGALALPSFATGGETYLKRLTLILSSGAIEHVLYPVPDPACHAGVVLRLFRKENRT
ncbi:peroxiredoxin [Methyloceanibacter sp.]|uniref:peroxiredoxin n=1 Tax=Methyloceanibacter sp. TaxID=1965321 RepID=UPI003D6D6FC6